MQLPSPPHSQKSWLNFGSFEEEKKWDFKKYSQKRQICVHIKNISKKQNIIQRPLIAKTSKVKTKWFLIALLQLLSSLSLSPWHILCSFPIYLKEKTKNSCYAYLVHIETETPKWAAKDTSYYYYMGDVIDCYVCYAWEKGKTIWADKQDLWRENHRRRPGLVSRNYFWGKGKKWEN